MVAAWRRAACVASAFALAGCAQAATSRDAWQPPAYAEQQEYFVPTNQVRMPRAQAATTGTTYYFQTDTKRRCYAFRLPGTWELGSQQALLRRIDGSEVVGVLLFGVRELGASSAQDAIRNAAERSGEQHTTNAGPVPWKLVPYAPVAGAWHWTVPREFTEGTTRVRIVERWFVPVDDEWIAQFTIGVRRDDKREAFIEAVIRSLTTSREPRCYEKHLIELGGVRRP